MNGKTRVKALFDGKPTDRVGFWLGNPTDETKQIYCRQLGIEVSEKDSDSTGDSTLLTSKPFESDLELACRINSDFFWCSPELDPEEVSAEVLRLKDIFGEKFIVSPSHEALLPNVSIENVLAMRDAAIQ